MVPQDEFSTPWEERVRSSGLRLTTPRRRLLRALAGAGHATPEALAARVGADGQGPLPASTVYRNLEALTRAGLVAHSHLTHGAPAYHLVDHGDHLHLVCGGCGAVQEADPALAETLARNLLTVHRFDADVTHMAIHGRCAQCAHPERQL